MKTVIWIGTAGFGRRQADVMRDLAAVELNEVFYRHVRVERALKWRAQAPPEFRFAVKASQFITHEATSPTYRRSGRIVRPEEASGYGGFQDTAPVREGWDATREIAQALRAHVIVFETPPTFGPTDANRSAMYRFFESIRPEAVKGVELGGPWATHVVEKICEDLGLIHIVDPFDKEPATYGLAYFRLHGGPRGSTMHGYSYTDADLLRLKAICNEYDDAYVMFHNRTRHEDAFRFQRIVSDGLTGPRTAPR